MDELKENPPLYRQEDIFIKYHASVFIRTVSPDPYPSRFEEFERVFPNDQGRFSLVFICIVVMFREINFHWTRKERTINRCNLLYIFNFT